MFDPTSRYYSLETATFTTSDGRMLAYKRRRFVPTEQGLILGNLVPSEGERLDLVTARVFGDPGAFWRICDANAALSPFELLDEAGRALRVPLPRS
jgi:hypothetical protein